MRPLLATLALTLCLAGPVAADEYRLDARATEPVGGRWYLMIYPPVELEAGETESVWLSLASCPGGVESPPAVYVKPVPPGPYGWQQGWFHPVPYGTYHPDVAVTLANHSAGPMTFKLKASVRCGQ